MIKRLLEKRKFLRMRESFKGGQINAIQKGGSGVWDLITSVKKYTINSFYLTQKYDNQGNIVETYEHDSYRRNCKFNATIDNFYKHLRESLDIYDLTKNIFEGDDLLYVAVEKLGKKNEKLMSRSRNIPKDRKASCRSIVSTIQDDLAIAEAKYFRYIVENKVRNLRVVVKLERNNRRFGYGDVGKVEAYLYLTLKDNLFEALF